MARGKFIALDGPDGAGKSLQVQLLTARLRQEGIPAKAVREPGQTPVGQQIRVLLLDDVNTDISALATMFLFNADRAQTHEVVRGYLDAGEWVVADRSWLSTIAYQCFGEGFDLNLAMQMCQVAINGVKADLMLLLTVSDQVAQSRRGGRGTTDRFEQESLEFHARVKEGFNTIATELGLPFVDGDPEPEQVHNQIWAHVEPLLRER